ncbi:hypothetical protein KZO25_10390 [Halomonas sp. ANAO-440]|uniref:cell division protein ZipA C-terminal FtsZ-binding domain-containing protein n=1 Tax=Halomonas sp. ANAO-440 TaxID=2861360 RepID=UPI001CAA7176|nr:cell division protein ZipA C-terminal FtsZ-binding domain-containing protein [Halomonas sp. ANAO-440]MBZ0330721.1 hypothetical protein [Halomonas sp. ANAO-440]
MEPAIVVLLLAGGALLLAMICMVMYFSGRARRSATPPAAPTVEPAEPAVPAEPEAPARKAVAEPAEPPQPSTHRFQTVSGTDIKQCLFVVLDWPGLDTNRRLAKLFREVNAHYDEKLGVYVLRDPQAGYKLTIANSSPPGTLPPIHEGDDQPIVPGVSILIHFINKRSVARNPETLIRITQSIVAIGGHILDADRNEVSKEEFEQLRKQVI